MSNIHVTIPLKHGAKVRYSLNCLLHEFLGIKYTVVEDDLENFIFSIDQKSFTIKNDFFKSSNKELISVENIPSNVTFTNITIGEKKMPLVSLFGNGILTADKNGLFLNSDLLGASFFMLTRWEEFVIKEKDNHNRFPGSSSVAVKKGFIDRPIVNEYVEIFWELLLSIGFIGDRKKYNYKIVPTHDVDNPFLWNKSTNKVKYFISNLLKRNWSNLKIGFRKWSDDPWDTHDFLMDKSEDAGVKSHFFFMAGGTHYWDNRYKLTDPKVKGLILKIENRGHHIGLHPSYESYNNGNLIKSEKEALKTAVNAGVEIGRQHFLRFEIPTTWRIWDEAEMKWDSTLSYADRVGFRCGVCYPYPAYDIENDTTLNVYERPLIVMEVTLKGYMNLDTPSAIEKIQSLKKEVKKHNGEFVFLWHNSSLNINDWESYHSVLDACYNLE